MTQHASKFSVSEARDIVRDFFHHRAAIYWSDFLVSLSAGYGAAAIFLSAPAFSLSQIAAYFVAGFALFRVGSFIHEIIHFPGNTLRRFKVAWNILAGIPMLMPSFFYGNHIDHHSSRSYGTGLDGEYLPLGSGRLSEIGKFYTQVIFLPIAILLRFLVLTPVSFLHPRLRQWTLERTSSFVINLRYRRQIPENAPRAAWAVMEWCCFLRAAAMVGCAASGLVPFSRLLQMYLLGVLALGLNYIRNLVAHRYASDGIPMSHVDQLSDSVNIVGAPIITELFFPLNLRYHALHHLFPTLPYHNLPAAHRRLIAELPESSIYRSTIVPGFWAAVRRLRSERPAGQTRHRLAADRATHAWYRRRARQLRTRARQTAIKLSSI